MEQAFAAAAASQRDTDKVVRYSVKCPWCKERWMEEAFGWQSRREKPIFGLSHRCPTIVAAIPKMEESARWRAKQLGEGTDFFKVLLNQFEMAVSNRLIVNAVKWTRKPVPTKCDARCMGAKGFSCDCQCQGKNHGRDSVVL